MSSRLSYPLRTITKTVIQEAIDLHSTLQNEKGLVLKDIIKRIERLSTFVVSHLSLY